MSANNAKGGVNNNPNFDSPNITDEEELERLEKEVETERRRKSETVAIDGKPIDKKELKYRSEDIDKREKTEYFVNIEGAEERARAARRAQDEMAAYLDVTAEEEYKEGVRKARAEQKRATEANKKEQKRIEEANKRAAEASKKEQKRIEKASNEEFRQQERLARKEKKRNFWTRHGKRILATVAILAVLIISGGILAKIIIDNRIKAENEAAEEAAYVKIDEIRDLMYDSDTPSEDVMYAYENAIASTENNNGRFLLEMSYVEYLIHYEGFYDDALEKLNNYAGQYNDSVEGYCRIIDNYIEIYVGLNDEENILKYEDIRSQKCTIGDDEDGYM